MYECKIIPKVISAAKIDDNLFGTKCKAIDLECKLTESIVIWKPDVLLNCPFRPLKYSVDVTSQTNDNGKMIIINKNMSIAFEIIKSVTECQNKTLLLRTDGSYLSFHKEFRNVASGKFSNELIENNAEIGLELAQMDFLTVVQKKIDNELVMNECNSLKKSIEIFSMENEKFGKFSDLQQNELILYSRDGLIYQPYCESIKDIRIINVSSVCYEDIPIQFNYTSKSNATVLVNGFLLSDNIIKDISTEKVCNSHTHYIKLKNSNYTIKKYKNSYDIMVDMKFKRLNIHRQHYDTELVHDDGLIHGINYIEQMNEMTSIKEIDGNSWVIHDSKKIKDGALSSFKDSLILIFHYAVLIISIIIVIVLYFILKCFFCIKKRFKNEDDSYNKFLDNLNKYKNNHIGLIGENENGL